LARVYHATTNSIRIVLSVTVMIPLIIASFLNQFPSFSYEITDQGSQGIFSSLSRNFDKTLENINSADKSGSSSDGGEDNRKVSDKQDDGANDVKPESPTQNNKALTNSNGTITDTSVNELGQNPSLINSTESVEIKPIDLKT